MWMGYGVLWILIVVLWGLVMVANRLFKYPDWLSIWRADAIWEITIIFFMAGIIISMCMSFLRATP